MLLADNTKSFQEISKAVAQQAVNQQELQQRIDCISQDWPALFDKRLWDYYGDAEEVDWVLMFEDL